MLEQWEEVRHEWSLADECGAVTRTSVCEVDEDVEGAGDELVGGVSCPVDVW